MPVMLSRPCLAAYPWHFHCLFCLSCPVIWQWSGWWIVQLKPHYESRTHLTRSLLVYVLSNYSEGQDSSLVLTINMWLLSKDKWVYLYKLAGWLNTGMQDWWSGVTTYANLNCHYKRKCFSFKTEWKFILCQVGQSSFTSWRREIGARHAVNCTE